MEQPAGHDRFVGRTTELTALDALLGRLARGEGGLVLLSGEPGIGKTRTARELAARARARGLTVLWGAGYEGEWQPPYGPWVEALGDCARSIDPLWLRGELGPGAAALAHLVPELRPALPEDEPPPAAAGADGRFSLHDAAGRLLVAVSERQPLLLLLDDLHWADVDSLALLKSVARLTLRTPLLLVLAFREEGLDLRHPLFETLATLRRGSEPVSVHLRGLSREDVRHYLEGAWSDALPDRLAATLHDETAGNPFYLRELLLHLVEGPGPDHDGGPSLAESPAARSIPDGVRRALSMRLARLPDDAIALLRAASLFSGTVEFRILQAITGLPEDAALDALDAALTAGLLRAEPGPGERYVFGHAIVRHALYDELSAVRRVRLHRMAAAVLQRIYAAAPDAHAGEIAYHLILAAPGGDAEAAAAFAERAGDHALTLLAFDEAARWYDQARMVLEEHGGADHRRACALLLAKGDAQGEGGDVAPARESFAAAAVLARQMIASGSEPEGTALLARAALGYAWRWAGGSVNERVVAVLEEALAALDPADAALRPLLLARLSVELRYSRALDRRLTLAREAVELARDGDDPNTLIAALLAEHAALDASGEIARRLAIATEIAAIAEREHDARAALEAAYWRIPDLLTTAELAGLEAQLSQEARLAEQARQPYYLWIVALHRCMNALRAGALEEAERLAEDALALGSQIEPDAAGRWHGIQVYVLRRDQGRLAEIVDLLDDLVRRFGSIAGARAMRAEVLLAADRAGDARAVLDELAADRYAAVGRDVNWLGSAAPLSALCAALADGAAAKTLYELLLPSAGMLSVLGPALAVVGSVDHHLGVLAATAAAGGDAHLWDAALRHLEDALAQHERLAAPVWLARTRVELAAVLLARRREPERARALLEEARAMATALGLGEVLARVDALSGRAGAPPPARPRYPDGLTAREVDVLRLIAGGLTNREIADALVVSITTVERHITNLYTKIAARGRADATAYAFRHALAEPRADG